LEALTGNGPGKTKGARDKAGSFADLIKALLENIKKTGPELAEGQIQSENTDEALKSGKNQAKKPAALTIIPRNKDNLTLSKEKNANSRIFYDGTEGNEGAFLSEGEKTDKSAGIFASLHHEQGTKDLPLPAEDEDFPQKDAIHSLADLMRPDDSGRRAVRDTGDLSSGDLSGRGLAVKGRSALFAGLAGKTGRAESSETQGRGLVDLNKAGKTGEREETRTRRERLSRAGTGSRFELRDFRGDAEPKNIPEKAGEFTLAGKREIPGTELVVRLEGRSPAEGRENPDTVLSPRDALTRELRGALGQDIVRHASMILKDGGEGLIRLSLKPESLGNVKIRLELSENKIAGHIIVESSDALRAFERELPVLEAAFRDSGFSGATLDLAQNGADGAGGQRNGEDASPFYSESLAASSYEALVDYRTGDSEALVRGDARINMLA
jgi:hypothetical protein